MDVLQTTEAHDDPTTRTGWTWSRLARVGGIAFIVAQGVMVASGAPIALVAPVAFITGAFVAFLRAERRGVAIGFTVFAAVLLAVNAPFAAADLAQPESAPSFIPQFVTVVTLTVTAIGALGVAARWSRRPTRAVLFHGTSLFVATLAGSLLVWTTIPSDEAKADDVAFGADGFAWEADVVTVDGGTSAALWVNNRDGGRHVLAIAELGVDVELPASRARRVELGDPAAGEYEIVCTIPGHEHMVATLVVTE